MSKVYFFQNTTPSTDVSVNRREVYWPKSLGTSDHYDPSLRMTFSSKQQMRQYMAQHKLRDAGERINPEKHIQGRERSKGNPKAAAIAAYLQSQGGTQGLLKRIREGKGHFV